jgi:hypothetical protein
MINDNFKISKTEEILANEGVYHFNALTFQLCSGANKLGRREYRVALILTRRRKLIAY